MSKFKMLILFILNIIVDLVLLSSFKIFGASIGISIPLIVILSMNAKTDRITYYPILLGLFKEVNIYSSLGIFALSYYLISYFTFKRSRIGGLSYKLGVIIVSISVVFNYLFTNSLRMVSLGYFELNKFLAYLFGPIFIEIFASIIIYSILFFIFYRINFNKKRDYFL